MTQSGVGHTPSYSSLPVLPWPKACSERTSPRDASRGSAAGEALRRKVLLFDDSALCLAFGGEVLTREGFDVSTAQRLLEFDQLLVGWQPDVVLADIKMPEIDGAALCRRLKQSPRTARVLVVLFSNLSPSRLEELAADCGADSYVSKTGGFDLLPVALSSLCEEILW